MARVFSITFIYKGQPCPALVSFEPGGCDMSYLVRYLDRDISQLVPGGKIVVSLSEGIKSTKALSGLGQDLVYRTTEAISTYLHQKA
ncbi:MAG: hypothetical protein ACJ749_03990 [Flavisolibacter sp.]